MTAHKHEEMIKAKADNMDLVVFIQHDQTEWEECVINKNCIPSFDHDFNYFLCLPQHKEACLHWLNGGDIEFHDNNRVNTFLGKLDSTEWSALDWYMLKGEDVRIKPRKENRWIAVNNSGYATPMTFISKQECESYVSVSYQKCPGVNWQNIEIEIEV